MPRRPNSLDGLSTELPDSRTSNLSEMSTAEIMKAMNDADSSVAEAVRRALPKICEAAEAVSMAINSGGRVFYLGAGTGGRIAVQDAAEVPPTFGFGSGRFHAIIAGGNRALRKAVENAEDDTELAAAELKKRRAGTRDAVVGLTASGRTPFVVSGLKFASTAGCRTICLTSNRGSPITVVADVQIVVETGPEVLAGSTRLKAGTAQKLVLNMLSTFAGIRAGRVIGNRMVGMKPTNEKLRVRAVGIVSDVAQCSSEMAKKALVRHGYDIEKAIEHVRRSP